MFLVSPDDPAHANVCEAEFVARGIDRDNTGKFEVPQEFGIGKGCDEGARCTVDCENVRWMKYIMKNIACREWEQNVPSFFRTRQEDLTSP